MKPKPFASLNHLTVPSAIKLPTYVVGEAPLKFGLRKLGYLILESEYKTT
jgi:hypothetical protein